MQADGGASAGGYGELEAGLGRYVEGADAVALWRFVPGGSGGVFPDGGGVFAGGEEVEADGGGARVFVGDGADVPVVGVFVAAGYGEIGRASCRERV